jgi:hypothetical protein
LAPTGILAAVAVLEIRKQGQFTQVAFQSLRPQLRLPLGVGAAVVKPVGSPAQAGGFGFPVVVFEIRVDLQVLAGAHYHEFRDLLHLDEVDPLGRLWIVLVKTNIGSDDICHFSFLLLVVRGFYQRRQQPNTQ